MCGNRRQAHRNTEARRGPHTGKVIEGVAAPGRTVVRRGVAPLVPQQCLAMAVQGIELALHAVAAEAVGALQEIPCGCINMNRVPLARTDR